MPDASRREEILEILRSIVADEDESGAYRRAAARLLLMPELTAGECQRPCCTQQPYRSTIEWIKATRKADAQRLREARKRAKDTAQASGPGDAASRARVESPPQLSGDSVTPPAPAAPTKSE